jgi:hypothetical protein
MINNTMTRSEVSKLLSEAQEKINLILQDDGVKPTPADYERMAEWQDDVNHIFTELTDEISWVMQGKPMLPTREDDEVIFEIELPV